MILTKQVLRKWKETKRDIQGIFSISCEELEIERDFEFSVTDSNKPGGHLQIKKEGKVFLEFNGTLTRKMLDTYSERQMIALRAFVCFYQLKQKKLPKMRSLTLSIALPDDRAMDLLGACL